LLKLASGEWKPILSIQGVQESATTYNFEVAKNHDYFVGQNGWLVHNQSVISMDDAIERGANFVGKDGVMETTGKGTNFQFRVTETNASGQIETRIGRFDVNPLDSHVQKQGAHLNLQKQINGKTVQNQHVPISPKTIRSGDIP